MSDNVVLLNDLARLPDEPPDAEVCTLLERWLARAKRGEIRHVVIAGGCSAAGGQRLTTAWYGDEVILLAASAALSADVASRWTVRGE